MKTKTYKIGLHRGNGRIFLEGNLIESHGFKCGMEYTRIDDVANGVITLHAGAVCGLSGLHFKPNRRVTQSIRNGKARPIIDLSDATISKRFAGFSRVQVEFHQGMLIYRGAA